MWLYWLETRATLGVAFSTALVAGFRFACRGGDSWIGGMIEYVAAEGVFFCLILSGLLLLLGMEAGNSTGSRGMWKVGDGVLISLARFAFCDDWRRGCWEPDGEGVIISLADPLF